MLCLVFECVVFACLVFNECYFHGGFVEFASISGSSRALPGLHVFKKSALLPKTSSICQTYEQKGFQTFFMLSQLRRTAAVTGDFKLFLFIQ